MASDGSLIDFVSSLTGGDVLRVEESLGGGYVRLRTAEAERRQAKHDVRCVEDALIELLRNARDAGASRIFVGTSREGNIRTIVVVDDGCGIPPELHERVFDARVTSKLDSMRMDRWGVHGRGMALFSISENATSAEVMASDVGKGCAMRVMFDVSQLPERADQSSWPEVKGRRGKESVRGPHNLYRTCVEFGLEERGTCNVYVGSPSEALATMRARVDTKGMVWNQAATGEAPVAMGPALARDAREMACVASILGIEISERNAHRILVGQISPLPNAVARATGLRVPQDTRSKPLISDEPRRLELAPQDESDLSLALREAFELVAERYYVRLTDDPIVRMGPGRMTVTYEFGEDE